MARFGRRSGSHEYGGVAAAYTRHAIASPKQHIRRSGYLNVTLRARASLTIPPSSVSLICFYSFFLLSILFSSLKLPRAKSGGD